MRVINFAQGEFLMLGMYFTFYLVARFDLLPFFGPSDRTLYRRIARGAGARSSSATRCTAS